jgi:hypothetical protein
VERVDNAKAELIAGNPEGVMAMAERNSGAPPQGELGFFAEDGVHGSMSSNRGYPLIAVSV